MQDTIMQEQPIDGFEFGTLKLVCRWRVFNRRLPMENRHIRALGAREIDERPVSPALVAWAKQHLEWNLQDGATEFPNGVLLLVVDDEGKAAMSLGEYVPLSRTATRDLIERAKGAWNEARDTRVSPEDLWAVKDDTLIWGSSTNYIASASSSLVCDLARTWGMRIKRDESLIETVQDGSSKMDEVFLVSDEHGIVPASNKGGSRAKMFAAGYQKLLNSMLIR
ncbi:MAG: hypothetical protein Q4B54_00495 [Coriobacteriales bacterium]|nr:hypothetical protein [Coriobacteriales bacterium]